VVRTAIRTTKAIIRESARLVNLTLGRAGFFICSAGSYAEGDLWNKWGSPRSAYHAIQKSRDGVVFAIANLHPSQPLTSGFFGLFRLRRRNKKLAFPVPSSPPAYPKNRFLKLHLPTFGTLRSRWLYDFLNALADTDTLFHLLCHLWEAVRFRPLSSVLCQAVNQLPLSLA
jgi:hypothetical protein